MGAHQLERIRVQPLASAGVTRRTALRLGSASLLGLWAGAWCRRVHACRVDTPAKACIVLWMNGGPSHIDTFDPKPGAHAGAFRSIETALSGVRLCEHLPRLAALADKLTFVRGMTSREGSHERAQYLLRTGYAPSVSLAHPSLGAWTAKSAGDALSDLPLFVSINGPSIGAGFLGSKYDPFIVRNPARPPENTEYAGGVGFVRLLRRKAALDLLESQFELATGDARVSSRRRVYGGAIRLMFSPRLHAFDIAEEPASVRARYGDSDFGRGCLLARRLVEAGVRYVEVTLDGWDTHVDNFGRTSKLCGVLDPAMSSLVRELDERNLLRSTLVVQMGEFGRTPTLNAREGRDHHPHAWSVVLAGCGIRPGICHGVTNEDGAQVVRDRVTVPDLFATLITALGMDPSRIVPTPSGRPLAMTDGGVPVKSLLEPA